MLDSDYKILKENVLGPVLGVEEFKKSLKVNIDRFEENNLIIESIKNNKIGMKHYHGLLQTLFHQVWVGPGTFAMAGSLTNETLSVARDYLIHHAEEEKLHWTWVISDLRSTGFKGVDPRAQLPTVATQAYLSYATYLALRYPIGRLAMAAVLEGISAKFGEKYGMTFMKTVDLKPEQMRFFLSHSVLDQGHSEDIIEVISSLPLSEFDYAKLAHIADCTQVLYKQMYNHACTAAGA